MSSNFLSRILPPPGEPSIYETIREHEELAENSDDEARVGTALDEQNFHEPFRDQDLDHHILAEAAESQTTTESTAFGAQQVGGRPLDRHQSPDANRRGGSRPRWMRGGVRHISRGNRNDDVPESLLLERAPEENDRQSPEEPRKAPLAQELPHPVPGPSSRTARVQWDTAREQQRLYDDKKNHSTKTPASLASSGYYFATPEQKAMWRWANVEDLDNFLTELYNYYLDKGIWSITLARCLRLLMVAFVVLFGLFLTHCVNYHPKPDQKTLSDLIISKCLSRMSFFSTLILWVLVGYWFFTLADVVLDIRRLRNLQDFYTHLLGVSDSEMQTISWQEVVGRLMNLRDDNPRTALKVSARTRKYVGEQSKNRMDAHDIANRIMRRENYFIAMINKDILDVTLPIPFLRHRQLYSRNLEWNINQCILGYAFNSQGQVYQCFLKDTDRQRLIEGLRQRFVFYGCMNLIQAPFLIVYNLAAYFFRYFKEFQSNPSSIGSRAYTPMAEWKFREFNELWHFFRRRADMSIPFASRYLDQFPKDKTAQVANFVAFVSGALAAILVLVSALDPELLNFTLTQDRTVLFYLGALTIIWTVARGLVPEDNLVFDPEFALQNVVNYTHYNPAHWKGRLHTEEVRREFSSLFQMKIMIFLEEVLSILFTPLILWFCLPKCSDRIIDFFREFTVHVDGLGYVCSFALFEFKKGDANSTSKKAIQPTTEEGGLREDYYSSKDNKMLASYYSFIDSYANNPRRGVHRPGKGRFHPPPSFPGLASSTSPNPPGTTSTKLRNPKESLTVLSPTQRPNADPSPSLLLDPHHQPPASLSRRLSRPMSQSRYRPNAEPVVDEVENEDATAAAAGGPAAQPVISSSVLLDEDNQLGDSWKTTRAAEDEDDDDEREAPVDDKTGGVLGLLYQFQKAQTETRGTGVGGI